MVSYSLSSRVKVNCSGRGEGTNNGLANCKQARDAYMTSPARKAVTHQTEPESYRAVGKVRIGRSADGRWTEERRGGCVVQVERAPREGWEEGKGLRERIGGWLGVQQA